MVKKLLLIGILAFLVLAISANAQVEDRCYLGTADVVNTISDSTTHVKLVYRFLCANSSDYSGQATKMIIKIPYADLQNLDVSDGFGSMKVLEGPAYYTLEKGISDSTIGVIFRKGLLVTNEETAYTVAIEFDSSSLVKKSDATFSLKPSNLVVSPKVTLISKGVTETTFALGKINYELVLPSGAGVQETSEGCKLSSGKVTCSSLEADKFNSIETKWTYVSAPTLFTEKIKQITTNLLPKVTSILKTVVGKGIKTAEKVVKP